MPGSIISGVRIGALRLSAVTVVTISAPRTASAVLGTARDCRPGRRKRLQIEQQFCGGGGVGVEQPQFADAEHVMKGDGLKFALRAVADERHDSAVGARQVPRGERGDRPPCATP